MAEDAGLDSLMDLKEFLGRNPELNDEFSDELNMIKTIHPCWSPTNITQQTHIDEAKQLERARDRQMATSTSQQQELRADDNPFARLMDKPEFSERQIKHEKELKEATAKQLGLDKPQEQMVGQPAQPSQEGQQMVQVHQAQQEAAQQPGQRQLISVMQNQVIPQGEQTGFTVNMKPQ